MSILIIKFVARKLAVFIQAKTRLKRANLPIYVGKTGQYGLTPTG